MKTYLNNNLVLGESVCVSCFACWWLLIKWKPGNKYFDIWEGIGFPFHYPFRNHCVASRVSINLCLFSLLALLCGQHTEPPCSPCCCLWAWALPLEVQTFLNAATWAESILTLPQGQTETGNSKSWSCLQMLSNRVKVPVCHCWRAHFCNWKNCLWRKKACVLQLVMLFSTEFPSCFGGGGL